MAAAVPNGKNRAEHAKCFLHISQEEVIDMKRLHIVIAVMSAVVFVVASSVAVLALYVVPTAYQTDNLEIMKTCSDPSMKVIIRSWFQRNYNFTELINWAHETLDFVPLNESFPDGERSTNPIEIKAAGLGQCGEFSILYVAACLAHGYECRLVVATECGLLSWVNKHAWAEVKLQGAWVHVDPSERGWGEPQMYRQWNWGGEIGRSVRIFAFEERQSEEVTQNYA